MAKRKANAILPTSNDPVALRDREIAAGIERQALEKQGVIQGQAAEAMASLDAANDALAATSAPPTPVAQPTREFTRMPEAPRTEAAAMAAEYDEEYDEDENDGAGGRGVAVFSTATGVIEQEAELPPTPELPVITGDGTVEERIAKLEEANALLLQELKSMPAMMKGVLNSLKTPQQQQQANALAPGGESGGPPSAGADGSGSMAQSGGAGWLGMLPQLLAFGKSLGIFGSGDAKPKAAMANQFMEQMGQYLQIQQAMEQLQMAKMNNQTIWLARMARMFGKEGFAKLVSQGEGDDKLKTGFEGLIMSAGQQATDAKGDEGE